MLTGLALAAMLAACGGGDSGADTTPAARISAIKVMGDSLADVGTFGLRFTVQGSGSLTYPERIGETYGLGRGCNFFAFNGATFVANTTAGCSNYAIGGGVINGFDHPGRLGTDRFVAQVGARWRCVARGESGPVLVVMIGTAVTVDAMDADGHFLGGLILPGHGIMLRALEGGTAGLRVPTGEVVDFPKNTSDALTSGGTYAITGAIERMHRRLSAHCGRPPHTLMTGGAGWKVSPYLDVPHELVDALIFDGLLVLQAERAGG
jgi:hypothetical protein